MIFCCCLWQDKGGIIQSFDMAEKVRLKLDGEEIQGLVNFGEIVLEKGMIEIPEFHRIRSLQNGVAKVPRIDATFKISRTSPTYKKMKDWYFKDEVHDLTKVRTDAHGEPFATTLLPSCECIKYQEPPYDAASPTYAQIQVSFLPWDIQPV